VEGSVRVLDGGAPSSSAGSNKRVRVNARLVYAGSDSPVWSRTFEVAASEVMSLHRQLAAAIVGGDSHAVTARLASATQDSQAYDLYLKGRSAWATRSKDDLLRSIDYFQQAIDRDPQYAKAYAGLSDANAMIASYGFAPYADALSRAADAASRAIA